MMSASCPGSRDIFATFVYQPYENDPETLVYRALLAGMIREAEYADLYAGGRGRPAWPVGMMLRIMYIQKQEGLSDRALVRQLANNYRVRFLVGLPAVGPAPKRSTLIDFRARLLAREQHTLAFRQQQEFIATTALIAPEDNAIIDSTPLRTSAAQPTVVGLLQHAMRRVLLSVRAWDPDLTQRISTGLHLQPFLAKRFNRFASGIDSRQGRRLWAKCYRKAEKLLALIPDGADAQVCAACTLLQRVMSERGPEGTDRVPDRISTAIDPDARFGVKHGKVWIGYKLTLLTHAPTDLITGMDVMSAQHVDGDALDRCVETVRPAFCYPAKLDGDAAYTSQEHRRSMRLKGTCLIGPRTTKKRRGRVPGGGLVATRADRGRRSRIEHVHAHVVRWRHGRYTPYLGLRKTWLQATFLVCATNLVRLLELWRQGRLPIPGILAA